MARQNNGQRITYFHLMVSLMVVLAEGTEGKVLKIGWLSTIDSSYFGIKFNYGAVLRALEAIERDHLLPGHTISVIWREGCSEREALREGVELYYKENIDVMLGPPCSSGKNSTTLYMLVIIRAGNAVTCTSPTQAAYDIFRDNEIIVADFQTYPDDISDEEIVLIWTKVKRLGRIIIFCPRKSDERRFMLKAHDLEMTNEEYVFIIPRMIQESSEMQPWLAGDERDEDAREAYEKVLIVSYATLRGEEADDFRADVLAMSRYNPYNFTIPDDGVGSLYSPFLYDALYLYALAVNKTLEMGGDQRNGSLMFENMKGQTFQGMSGEVVMDPYAEREPTYWVNDLRPSGYFEIIMEVAVDAYENREVITYHDPLWGGGQQNPPADTPPCGFLNELCPPDNSGEM
ncbi:receptor-type guanylate cyclase gcy-28-like [Glandiceps talaboti]